MATSLFVVALFGFVGHILCLAEQDDAGLTCMADDPNCSNSVDYAGLIQSKIALEGIESAKTLEASDVGEDEEAVKDGEGGELGELSLDPEMQALLDRHNLFRCMHNAPPLVWDDAIAANSAKWAAKGLFTHSVRADPPQNVVNGESLGENLAWGNPKQSGEEATINWYSEIKDTKDGKGLATGMKGPTGGRIGHYTQVVWKSTKKIGCAKGKLNDKAGDYWVCQYSPLGNYGGQAGFEENVPALSKTRQDCGEAAVPDYEHCIPKNSVDKCRPCLYDSHCKDQLSWGRNGAPYNPKGAYCCPRLLLCLKNDGSGGCHGPYANCQPRCEPRNYPDPRECAANCDARKGPNFDWPGGAWTPEKWLGVTSCETPNAANPRAGPSPPAPAPAGGTPPAPSPVPPATPTPAAPPTPPDAPAPPPGPAPLTYKEKRAKSNELKNKIQKVNKELQELRKTYSANRKQIQADSRAKLDKAKEDYNKLRQEKTAETNELRKQQRSIWR